MHVSEYANNAKGIATMALDRWGFHGLSYAQHSGDEIDDAIHTGKCHAYSEILRLMTGRNVGTEGDLVKEVIAGM